MNSKTRLMGILNATPDSFFADSRCSDLETAIARGIKIEAEGADIIDIGGESTRPLTVYDSPSQNVRVDDKEEIRRVIPLIQALKKQVSIPLSIDTRKPVVAEAALKAGVSFINDVGGFADSMMRSLAAESGVEICVMHMQGTPENMQQNPTYPEGVVKYLINWFEKRVELLLQSGVKGSQVILDPGIGFGKTVADNLEILQNLAPIKALGFPVLLGVSRKSFMAKILQKATSQLLPATIAMNTALVLKGADLLRVHDVQEHRDVINLIKIGFNLGY